MATRPQAHLQSKWGGTASRPEGNMITVEMNEDQNAKQFHEIRHVAQVSIANLGEAKVSTIQRAEFKIFRNCSESDMRLETICAKSISKVFKLVPKQFHGKKMNTKLDSHDTPTMHLQDLRDLADTPV